MGNMTLLKLKRDEKEKRRELILLAAQELFSKRGIAGVTMRDVARKAGVSVGFIYRYFSGPADIFLELIEAGAGELHKKLEDAVEAKETRPFRNVARTYVNYLHENMLFYQMMTYFMLEGKLSDTAVGRLNSALRRIMNRVEVMFRNNGGRENSRILAHSFFAALNGVMISFLYYPWRTPQETKRHTLLLAETIAGQFEQEAKN